MVAIDHFTVADIFNGVDKVKISESFNSPASNSYAKDGKWPDNDVFNFWFVST